MMLLTRSISSGNDGVEDRTWEVHRVIIHPM